MTAEVFANTDLLNVHVFVCHFEIVFSALHDDPVDMADDVAVALGHSDRTNSRRSEALPISPVKKACLKGLEDVRQRFVV